MRHLPPMSLRARRSGVLVLALITVLAAAAPRSLVASAAPAARTAAAHTQVSRPQPDDTLITRADAADPELAAALDDLVKMRAAGEPFAIQEIEILDAWQAGLPIAAVEAEIAVSRALYTVFVAGTAREAGNGVVARWRSYYLAHALDIQARNVTLNAGLDQKVQPPDGSQEWQLYADPALYNQLSSAAQRRLDRTFGRKGRSRVARGGGSAAEAPTSVATAPPNTLVNNRTADASTQDTQSETTLVLGSGSTILASFNDSGSNAGGASHFTGIARSTDGGATFTDQGVLPNDANGDAGDPIYARNNTNGTVILATLGFNSGATLPTYRSTTDGASYLSQVDGDGGGTSNDKEWLTCDNFAGAGNGNFYLFYRDFGGGGGMSFTRSTDSGATWSSRQILDSAAGQGAWVTVGADHAVYCFWLATGNVLKVRKSTNLGVSFAAAVTITTLRTTGTNGDLGLGGGFRSNAFPQVVTNPVDANQLYMIWNDKAVAGVDKANVYFSQSTNGGANWSAPVQVNADLGTNDNWQPCLAITPDGSALFVSWYDRRLDVTNSMIDVYGRNATISGTTVTFGNDYRISDGSWPVVIGQDGVIVATYMGDYDQAVADNANFYRTWGDNRLSLLTHSHQPDVRFTKVPKAGPGAIVGAGAAALVAENCTPPNNAVDPGEMVTVSLGVTNVGTGATTNVVGTLQATGGVMAPSGPATYGAIAVNGTVSQNFTFTASGTCGGTVTATLQLQDGATNLGSVTYTFQLGTIGGTTTMATYSSGGVMVPVPASGTSGDMADQIIAVPDVGAVTDVNVKVRLNHTFDGDLTLKIVSPNGTSVTLSNRRGGSGDNFGSGTNDCAGTFTVFDDAAGTPIGSGTAPFAGSFKPDSPLSAINNSVSNGNWTLQINDGAGGDQGILFCWQLEITRAQFLCSTSCGVPNVPPVANAGTDQAVNSCTGVTLNGGGSSDPDGGPVPLTYAWSQTAGPTVRITGASTSAPSFESPNVAVQAVLTFQLTVSDGAAMNSDTVDVTVNHVSGVNVDTVGIYTTGANNFFLRNCNAPGPADIDTNFGIGGWVPLRGDWDNNGTETEGAYDPTTSCFFLRNTNTPGPADIIVCFGAPGSTPLVGDWDGNGSTTIGTYDAPSGTFFLKNSLDSGDADVVFVYGAPNMTPLTGDWDGNGTTTVGVYHAPSSTFFLINTNTSGNADLVFQYGVGGLGAVPIAGDWDGLGGDSVGIYFPSSGFFFLKNSNTPGNADIGFQFGPPGSFAPLAGNWDGF